ncbi:MAG: hypothetical protein CMQ20_10225 [Gammaproteobacteria bacterium]|nr:hypothetical protein [Gammaproteobacteria bacterium]
MIIVRNTALTLLLMFLPFALTAEDQVVSESAMKTLVWPDGTRYVGGVEDGKRTGRGTIFRQDGTRFVGEFSNDMRNGPGTMILPDGTVYTGYFKDDELVDSPAASTITSADTGAGDTSSESQALDSDVIYLPVTGAQDTQPALVRAPVEEPQDEPVVEITASVNEPLDEPAAPVDEPVELASEELRVATFNDQVTTLTDDVKQELVETIDLWGAAWSDQNVPQYLSNYAEDFRVPGKLNRNNWEALRRSRLTRPRYINLDIVYGKFEMVDTNLVDVFFRQKYQSNLYRDVTNKILRMRKEEHVWKIVREKSR